MRRLFAFASLCLLYVFGTALQSNSQSTALPMSSTSIPASDWSFECVNESPCGTNDTDIGIWPTTMSQPGTVRLWNSGTSWAIIDTGTNVAAYDWTNTDTWLDMIAAHQPRAAIYTFGHTPCYIASQPCTPGRGGTVSGTYWSPSPPIDLTPSGSPTFNMFVTQLVEHCSAAGNCVKDYIQYWELWNEPNLSHYWSGTQTQLYDMLKPAVAIIRQHIPKAIVSTPPVSGGDSDFMTTWINIENTNGRISNYYGFHSYLSGYEPEARYRMISRMVDAKNQGGWTKAPWMNTETNFDVNTYVCPSTPEDCDGQLVRWHVLQYAYQGGAGGAFHVGWYYWPTITANGYDTYYYTMMQWIEGGTFTASCTNVTGTTIWTCPLNEGTGATALIVWNASGNSSYTPATQYIDYKSFNGTYGGTKTSISPGEATTIGLIPIMFETAN